MGARVLVVDNYDSFVYNLVQELGELGAEPVVYRNDAISVEGIRAERPDAVLVSPGPGRPEDGGVSLAAIAELAFVATRYHSLVVDPASVPDTLVVTATSSDGVVMGLRHRELAVEGVQFHPESVLTASGPALLANFLHSLAETVATPI